MYMHGRGSFRRHAAARPQLGDEPQLPRVSYGRFLQADPIGYDDGMNMYGYVGGDPINNADPSGLCADGTVAALETGTRIHSCLSKDGVSSGFGVSAKAGGYATGVSGAFSAHPLSSFGWMVPAPPSQGSAPPSGGGQGCSNILLCPIDLGGSTGVEDDGSGAGAGVHLASSGSIIKSLPVDADGYHHLNQGVIGGGLFLQDLKINVQGLRSVKIITRFTTVLQCRNCMSFDVFGGSYAAHFLNNGGSRISSATVRGIVGPAFAREMSVPGGSRTLHIRPTVLTPPDTQVVVRGRW